MISDLEVQPNPSRSIQADAVIVGAGIAGLVLAARLRRHGMRVAVLESGGLEQVAETHPLNRVVQLGDNYAGAMRGRFRCLGGTSTRWGGALLPFLANDLAARPHINLPAFPVGMDVVLPYLGEVERQFGLNRGSYEEKFVEEIGAARFIPTGDTDFQARFAKWPSFKKRNVATLYNSTIQNDRDLEVSINSTVAEINADAETGRVVSVIGRHQNGRSITAAAKHFIICAGAIETTRLLLLFDRQYNQHIFQGCEALGRYFYDHISDLVALIRPTDVTKLNRMAGFRFVDSTMRSLRFELSPSAQSRERVGSANGHISFRTEQATGFDILRQLLRSRQRGEGLKPELLRGALREIPYFARLGFWRAVHRQLLWPRPAIYELHVVAEQMPRRDNSIALASETDAFGLPLAAINWRVGDQDRDIFAVYKRLFNGFWDRHGLSAVGELNWTGASTFKTFDQAPQADVYHPGGSARMGTDRSSAVINSNLGVFGVPNLWTASTSAFPSGGGANPTLTLILFTMRLADHLAKRI